MRTFLVALGLAALSLSGCSVEQSVPDPDPIISWEVANAPINHQLVNSLVDTFDVPSCIDARLRYAGRKDTEQSVFHQRHFDASDQCVRDVIRSASQLGFASARKGEWHGTIVDGVEERIKTHSYEDLMRGNLLWEVDVT